MENVTTANNEPVKQCPTPRDRPIGAQRWQWKLNARARLQRTLFQELLDTAGFEGTALMGLFTWNITLAQWDGGRLSIYAYQTSTSELQLLRLVHYFLFSFQKCSSRNISINAIAMKSH